MNDSDLQNLLETWVKAEISGNGGEINHLGLDLSNGNICIHFEADQNPFEASPFTDDKTCIYEQAVSLSHEDGKYRSLIKGTKILEEHGVKIVWLTSLKDYGQYTDLPDEHTMSAWISKADNFEVAVTARDKAFQDLLVTEIDNDLRKIVEMTTYLQAPISLDVKSYISNHIKNIARNTLCL